MVKNLIQDVVPPERKSIKRIPVPSERPRHLTAVDDDKPAPRTAPKKPVSKTGRFVIPEDSRPATSERNYEPSLPYTRETYSPEEEKKEIPPRASSKALWLVAATSVVVLFLIFSFAFAGVKMIVVPREETAALNAQFTAVKGDSELPFEVMTLTKTGDKTVPASGKQHVEKKAFGTITISNNYSTAAQKLVRNTRFQTAAGLIYRVSDDITVPGQSILNGKTVPGTLDVTVYADKVGADYNISQSDFTIPGFKGDPRFAAITAKTKTSISGGFSGEANVVDDATLKQARESIRADILKSLLIEAQGQKPAEYSIIDGLYTVTYESNPETNDPAGTSAIIHEKATLSVAIFKETVLAKHFLKSATNASSSAHITNVDTLKGTINGEAADILENSFNFTVTGSPHFVWVINTAALKESLHGKPRAELSTVLSSYPEVTKADVSFRPFWRRSFPNDPNGISIVINDKAPENH